MMYSLNREVFEYIEVSASLMKLQTDEEKGRQLPHERNTKKE